MDSVLVTCPTAATKDYAFDAYLNAYNGFTYENRHLLMVDTSSEADGYDQRLRDAGVESVVRFECNDSTRVALQYLITVVWEDIIIPTAWETGADWIFHIESDIICPRDTVEATLDVADRYGASIVGHSYPARSGNDIVFEKSIGCIMWKRELFEPGHTFWDSAEDFVRSHAYEKGARGVQLTNVLQIEHLDG
jgi:hypothetical protein